MSSKKIWVKKDAVGSFGEAPEERTVAELINYGIVNLDKPKGPTSHQVTGYVKEVFGLNKAGHSGTLDPQVTGVQPTALGRATRITQFLLTAPKEYFGLVHLHRPFEEQKIREVILGFIGKIKQLPPIKSAVKRQLRTREIYELELLEIKSQELLIRVKCQAGTYIRKLAHDLGLALGTGAHLVELRRSQAGPFTEKDRLVTLNDLQDAYYFYREESNPKFLEYCLQPIERALVYFPKCWILDNALPSLTHGRDLAIPGISKLEEFNKNEKVAILTLKGELVAMGEALLSTAEIMEKEKGLAVKIQKVFMLEIN